jgi:hypothetical protein
MLRTMQFLMQETWIHRYFAMANLHNTRNYVYHAQEK